MNEYQPHKEPEDGGPAFPCEGGPDSGLYAALGMTLRDYFAAQALPQVIKDRCESDPKHAANTAAVCYAFADAMLKERAK